MPGRYTVGAPRCTPRCSRVRNSLRSWMTHMWYPRQTANVDVPTGAKRGLGTRPGGTLWLACWAVGAAGARGTGARYVFWPGQPPRQTRRPHGPADQHPESTRLASCLVTAAHVCGAMQQRPLAGALQGSLPVNMTLLTL